MGFWKSKVLLDKRSALSQGRSGSPPRITPQQWGSTAARTAEAAAGGEVYFPGFFFCSYLTPVSTHPPHHLFLRGLIQQHIYVFYCGKYTYTCTQVPGAPRKVGIPRNGPGGNIHRFWWGWRGSLCAWHVENQLAFLGTGEVK